VIYLDASALVTWVARRQYVVALEKFVGKGVTQTCTSTVGLVETVRTCTRLGNFPRLMATLLDDHVQIPLSDQVRDAAANFAGPVRSLDAIHIASAELLGSELTALVTYDKRMAKAASNAGLPVETPGMQ